MFSDLQVLSYFGGGVMQTVREKCFAKCVQKPGSILSGGESSCISRCVDRYIEATQVVSKAVLNLS